MQKTPAPTTESRPSGNPLSELRAYVTGFAARCRTAGWFGALVHVRITKAIVEDVQRQQTEIAAAGYSAEQEDLEAIRLLDEAAKDGFSNADLPAVAAAIRHIRRSANRDRQISEACHA